MTKKDPYKIIKHKQVTEKAVTLQVTDSSGYTCPGTEYVDVQERLPGWEEISPW